jgi:hypothetical protein
MFGRCGDCKQLFKANEKAEKLGTSGEETDHHVALPLRGRRTALSSPFIEGGAGEKDLDSCHPEPVEGSLILARARERARFSPTLAKLRGPFDFAALRSG